MLQNFTGIPTLLMERDAHSLKIFKQGFVNVGFHPANDEVRDACMTEKKQHALTVFLTVLKAVYGKNGDAKLRRLFRCVGRMGAVRFNNHQLATPPIIVKPLGKSSLYDT